MKSEPPARPDSSHGLIRKGLGGGQGTRPSTAWPPRRVKPRGLDTPTRHLPRSCGPQAGGGCTAQQPPETRNAWGHKSKQQGHVPQSQPLGGLGRGKQQASLEGGGNSQIRPRYCCF